MKATVPATILLLHLLLVVAPATARGEPRFAARMGAPCSTCHVNPSGGGMRNRFGRNVFENQQLTSGLGTRDRRFDSEVNEVFAFGADFRLAFIAQPTRDDVNAPPPPRAGLFVKTPTQTTFFPMQADLYFAADIGKNVALYSDLGAQGSFEIFGLVHGLPGGAYLKAGMFLPPFGTRLPNHTAAVRQPIGFDPRSKDAGVELGIVRPWLDAQIALQNGDISGSPIDQSQGLAVTARAAGILNSGAVRAHLGASVLRIESRDRVDVAGDEVSALSTDTRYGPFAWVSIGRVTWLGEADFRLQEDGTQPDAEGNPTRSGQFVTYQEIDLLVAPGFEVGLTHELMDRDTERRLSPPDNVQRYGASLAWFPIPYVEVNVIYRLYEARKEREEDGQQEALAFLHFFF